MQDGNDTRPQQAGEAGTTRFGMEDGDNTDVPATGLDPDQQGSEAATSSSDAYSHAETDEQEERAENEAAKLGDFA